MKNQKSSCSKVIKSSCRFIEETQAVIHALPQKGMDKQEFLKVNEVFNFLWKDLNRWKVPEEVEVIKFKNQETSITLGELVRETVKLGKNNKRSKSFNTSKDEKEHKKIETHFGYSKGGYTKR